MLTIGVPGGTFAQLVATPLAVLCCATAVAQVGAGQALQQDKSLWEHVQAVRPPTAEEIADEELAKAYWNEFSSELDDVLWRKLLHGPIPDREVTEFVDGFGSRDASTDLLWVLVDPKNLVPDNTPGLPPPPDTASLRNLYHWRDSVALAIARRAAKDAKFRSRYYRLVLWTGRLVPPSKPPEGHGADSDEGDDLLQGHFTLVALSASIDEIDENPLGLYGRPARVLVVLSHAFGRPDLADVSSRESVRSGCERLHRWVKANLSQLEPDPQEFKWKLRDENKRRKQVAEELTWATMQLPNCPFEINATQKAHPPISRELFQSLSW
jgi:hypothetical protein